MKIQVVICDHCERVISEIYVDSYRVGDGPCLHICTWCQSKPFRKVPPSPKGTAVAQIIQMALVGSP